MAPGAAAPDVGAACRCRAACWEEAVGTVPGLRALARRQRRHTGGARTGLATKDRGSYATCMHMSC